MKKANKLFVFPSSKIFVSFNGAQIEKSPFIVDIEFPESKEDEIDSQMIETLGENKTRFVFRFFNKFENVQHHRSTSPNMRI